MAAPVADRKAGFMAVGEVEGAKTVVAPPKNDFTLCAIFGVWDVPPESMTCHLVSRCRPRV